MPLVNTNPGRYLVRDPYQNLPESRMLIQLAILFLIHSLKF
jgi:hypothetical protein